MDDAGDFSQTDGAVARTDRGNWVSLVLVLVLVGWIGVIALAGQPIVWFVEQMFVIESATFPAYVWLIVALVQFFLLAVPLVPLAWFWRVPRYRAVFQTWALMAFFPLLTAPARLAPSNASELATLLQAAGAALYLGFVAVLVLWRKRRGGVGFVKPRAPYLPALLLAPLLACGWLVWGALGSVPDILLNLLAGLLFGLAAGLVVGHFFLGPLRRTSAGPGWDVALGGLVVSTGLLMMSTFWGSFGLQVLVMLALPASGWVLLALSHFGREETETGWLTLSLFLGLVAAAPLLLVDADELVLILNLGETGELLQWGFFAALLAMGTGWALGMLLLLVSRWLPRWRSRLTMAVVAGVVWLVAILFYVFVGQPGLHGDRLFVILEDQADLSTVAGIADYDERRRVAYDCLVAHAGTSQADLRVLLDRLGLDYTPYYLVNSMEVEGGPLVGLWLGTRPEVERVLHSPVLRPLPAPPGLTTGPASAPTSPQWNLALVGADRVWREFDVRGAGIVVGQSDSGVQWDHPELRASYRGRDGDHDYDWFDPWNHTLEPTDRGGHGTHTTGTIVGQTVGVAPEATWYGCVNLARNLANPALYLDCMQFMLAPFPLAGDPFADGDPTLGAHVINNSWGCPDLEGCDPGALLDGVRALRAAGVFVVASAGNDAIEGRSCETVRDPLSLYDDVFTVGAVDRTGRIAGFSSRGPVTADGSNRTKPDIVAPGVDVLSSTPGGTYARYPGTSMAGPHVVGVVALLWSANPDLIGDIERTEEILTATAQPYDYARHGYPECAGDGRYPNNAVGYGIVDAYAAVELALQEGGEP